MNRLGDEVDNAVEVSIQKAIRTDMGENPYHLMWYLAEDIALRLDTITERSIGDGVATVIEDVTK